MLGKSGAVAIGDPKIKLDNECFQAIGSNNQTVNQWLQLDSNVQK